MASLKSCKTCEKEVSSTAKTCPHCGQKLKSGFIIKTLKTVGAILAFLFILGLIIPDPDKPAASANTESEETVTQAVSTSQTARPDPTPSSQQQFLAAIAAAREASDAATNDMQKGAALASRERTICEILPSGKRVNDWHGTIYSIKANGDGKGVLVVTLEKDAWVSTWNNAISDIGTGTLIEPGTGLFAEVSALSPGDSVTFSGEFFTDPEGCISTQNFLLNSKISRPEFVFKFSEVRSLN